MRETIALPAPPQTQDWSYIRHWRVEVRKALIGRRMALPGEERAARAAEARRRLVESVDQRRYGTLGIYWPVRGEFDVRELAIEHLKHGGRVGLPVVV
jgi:5-formyltetrahydrofolate cyclo-ligase